MSRKLRPAKPFAMLVVYLCVASAGIGAFVSQQAQTPVLKGRLDLIRTEVAVVDNATGEPVSGLTQRDFTIRENGARQEIASFISLNSQVVQPDRQNSRRVFLIVLGAFHLPGPVQPHDGAIEFLRKRLRSDDLAAVMVWNRMTALTTDHERLAGIVQRARELPDEVRVKAVRDVQYLRDFSVETQAAIDAWLAPAESSDGFLRSASAAFLPTEEYREYKRNLPGVVPWERRIASRDIFKVYAGIEYLRHVEGQKRLVLLSAYGFRPPFPLDPDAFTRSTDEDHRLAAHANDAGVALDIIHTVGTVYGGGGSITTPGSPHFMAMSSQQVARESGGQFTSLRTAAEQLARIDAATRSGYIVGYVPTNPNLDGKYRTVDIQVNRRNVTVVYRRGYTARSDPPRADPRELMAKARLRDAAASSIRFDDIKVSASGTSDAKARQVKVSVVIDPGTLALTELNGRWTGSIDVMILCADDKDKSLGMLEQRMDVNMSQVLLDQARATGIPYATAVAVTAPAKRVKVVVYNYETDRLGSAVVAIK